MPAQEIVWPDWWGVCTHTTAETRRFRSFWGRNLHPTTRSSFPRHPRPASNAWPADLGVQKKEHCGQFQDLERSEIAVSLSARSFSGSCLIKFWACWHGCHWDSHALSYNMRQESQMAFRERRRLSWSRHAGTKKAGTRKPNPGQKYMSGLAGTRRLGKCLISLGPAKTFRDCETPAKHHVALPCWMPYLLVHPNGFDVNLLAVIYYRGGIVCVLCTCVGKVAFGRQVLCVLAWLKLAMRYLEISYMCPALSTSRRIL